MNFIKKNLSVILVFAAIGAYVVFAGKAGTCPTCVAITDVVGITPGGSPDEREALDIRSWAVQDLEGKMISAADLEGKVVILDFWATWCPPCRKEIPSFVELQETYGDQGLVVLGVSLDRNGPAEVEQFAREHGINYPLAMANSEIIQTFGGIKSIPTTFIIDREGRIVNRHVGYAPKKTFERDIEPLL